MAQDVGIAVSTPRGASEGQERLLWLDRSGALVTIDFFAKAIMDGYGWQVRAGTITTPLVGDVAITDTAAEYCVDIANGGTLIPVFNQVSVRAGTGTAHEFAIKSVAAASSAGTAFVPLPLKSNATTTGLDTARVAAAGGVTVTAEAVTTTRRHWEYAQQAVFTTGQVGFMTWEPNRPPRLVGTSAAAQCLYVQLAAGTTGPSYYAHLDYLAIPTGLLGG